MRLGARARLNLFPCAISLFFVVELLPARLSCADEPPSLDDRWAALKAIREAHGNVWPDIDKLRARGETYDSSNAAHRFKTARVFAKDGRLADQVLAALAAFPELEELDLSSSAVADTQLAKLPLRKLKVIDLNNSPVTDAGLDCLRTLENLEAINLARTAVTGRGFQALAALKNLRYVNLNETPAADAGIACLAQFPNLAAVLLNQTDVSDAALEHLRDNTKLERLSLAHTRVSDAGLAALERMSKLRELSLDETRVGDAGIEAIAHLPLAHVSLAGTRITDASATNIARWSELTWLDLSQTGITELAVKRLRGLTNLVFLNLRRVRLSDASLQALAKMDKLEQLGLAETPVTDAGLAYLTPLLSLKQLDLSGTNVSGPGLKNLLALPRLEQVRVRPTNVSSFYLNALAVRNALREKTELDFTSQPLSDVIDYLSQRHDIPVRLDYKSMTAAGIASDTAVTLSLKGVTLDEALKAMLGPLGLVFASRHEVLFIAARPLPQAVLNFPLVASGARLSPKLAEAFMERTELEFREQPLREVVAELGKRHNIEIALDAPSLAAAGIGLDVPINRWVKGITLKSVLELVLPAFGLVCVAEGDQVVIRAEKGS